VCVRACVCVVVIVVVVGVDVVGDRISRVFREPNFQSGWPQDIPDPCHSRDWSIRIVVVVW